MQKPCFKCGLTKPLEDFYVHPKMADGHLNKCKECTRKAVTENCRARRQQYRAYEKGRFQDPERKAKVMEYQRARRKRHPHKDKARAAVRRAIRNGAMQALPCLICGDPNSQAHHRDYSKPLEVEWLCFKHHREAHGQTVG